MLTARQHEILRFIAERLMDGRPPTLREIGQRFQINSTNGVSDHLRYLERKGALAVDAGKLGRLGARARDYRITDLGWRTLGAAPCGACGQWVLPGKKRNAA